MPYIPAFYLTDLESAQDILRDFCLPFKQASKSFARLPAWLIIRVTGNYNGGFPRKSDLTLNQSACPVCKVSSAVWRINMISDMSVIKHTSAFSVAVADLSDFPSAVVLGDPPYLLVTELQFGIRRINMNRNQVNYPV